MLKRKTYNIPTYLRGVPNTVTPNVNIALIVN